MAKLKNYIVGVCMAGALVGAAVPKGYASGIISPEVSDLLCGQPGWMGELATNCGSKKIHKQNNNNPEQISFNGKVVETLVDHEDRIKHLEGHHYRRNINSGHSSRKNYPNLRSRIKNDRLTLRCFNKTGDNYSKYNQVINSELMENDGIFGTGDELSRAIRKAKDYCGVADNHQTTYNLTIQDINGENSSFLDNMSGARFALDNMKGRRNNLTVSVITYVPESHNINPNVTSKRFPSQFNNNSPKKSVSYIQSHQDMTDYTNSEAKCSNNVGSRALDECIILNNGLKEEPLRNISRNALVAKVLAPLFDINYNKENVSKDLGGPFNPNQYFLGENCGLAKTLYRNFTGQEIINFADGVINSYTGVSPSQIKANFASCAEKNK